MKFEINEDILKKAGKCRHDFSCLSRKKDCFCQVEDNFDNSIIFVPPPGQANCEYLMSFGYSYVCNCPVRKAIFEEYRK